MSVSPDGFGGMRIDFRVIELYADRMGWDALETLATVRRIVSETRE